MPDDTKLTDEQIRTVGAGPADPKAELDDDVDDTDADDLGTDDADDADDTEADDADDDAVDEGGDADTTDTA